MTDDKSYVVLTAEELRKWMEEEPKVVCNGCLRKSWAGKPGDKCEMLQPDGSICPGFMVPWGSPR